jgi:hypothetical protein
MRSSRRWLVLAVPAALAALAALMFAVPAADSPLAASARQVNSVAAAAPHANGVVHIVRRGLVHDCEYIEFSTTILEIAGNGVNKPVTLTTAPANCWNLYNKFTVPYGTTVYTGYEYQNGDGHCLFDNGGVIDVGAACKVGHPNEEFFAIPGSQKEYGGWLISDVTRGPSVYMAAQDNADGNCGAGDIVDFADDACNTWNFPS